MELVQVVPDSTMMVAGYEHHTLRCAGCGEVERRLIFKSAKPFTSEAGPTASGDPSSKGAEPLMSGAIASCDPPAASCNGAEPSGAWEHALDMLRQQQLVKQVPPATGHVEDMETRPGPVRPPRPRPSKPIDVARQMTAAMLALESPPRNAAVGNKWARVAAKFSSYSDTVKVRDAARKPSAPDDFDRIWDGADEPSLPAAHQS
jgi:hypothetical protein